MARPTSSERLAHEDIYRVERFTCADGDEWFSVTDGDDVVTGVMHNTEKEATAEIESLAESK